MAVNVPLQTVFANTRAGTVYQTTSAGGIEAVSANTTRTAHWRGGKPHALFEPSRTNSIRNNTMQGAALGTLATTGVAPTNWIISNMATSAVEVTAFGTEDGLSYVEFRLNGTPTAAPLIQFSGITNIAAVLNETWTSSVWLKITAGSLTNITSVALSHIERNIVGSLLSFDDQTISPTSTRTRFPCTQTMDEVTAAYVSPALKLNWSSGAIDVTLRIYMPQMEKGAFATSVIATSGSAVTRAADNATCSVSTFPIDQNGGSIEIIGRADYDTSGSGNQRIFQIDDGTNNTRLSLLINESAGTLSWDIFNGGASQAAESIAYTTGTEFHAMVTFENDNVFLSLNGSDSTPDTTATMPVGLLTTWRWGRATLGDNGAAVLINQIASHSHEFSTTAANAITG